jgi:hypothetical protein
VEVFCGGVVSRMLAGSGAFGFGLQTYGGVPPETETDVGGYATPIYISA